MSTNKQPLRSCLRPPNASGPRAPDLAVRYNVLQRTRPIDRLNANEDPFLQETVPSNLPIYHRPEDTPRFNSSDSVGKWYRTPALNGDRIGFPQRFLSRRMVAVVGLDGSETRIPIVSHPRYHLPSTAFEPPSAWAEPEEVYTPSGIPHPFDLCFPSASSAMAPAEENAFERHARLSNAAAERRVLTHAYLEGWLIRAILAGKFPGCSLAAKREESVGKKSRVRGVKHIYHEDELRVHGWQRNRADSVKAYRAGGVVRSKLLREDVREMSTMPWYFIVGTNPPYVLYGHKLLTLPITPADLLDTSGEDDASRIEAGPYSDEFSPFAPLPDIVAPPATSTITSDDPDGLSIEEIHERLAEARAEVASTAERMQELEEDLARGELILEIEDDAALAIAMESEEMRKANRDRIKAERAAAQAQLERDVAEETVQTRPNLPTSNSSPPSSPPRPLPPALIPLYYHPWRRGRDIPAPSASSAPVDPPQPAQSMPVDRPRTAQSGRRCDCSHPLKRTKYLPEGPGEEYYVAPMAWRDCMAVEAQVETDFMRNRHLHSVDAVAPRSLMDSPKRKRNDDEELERTSKRARLQTPPPNAYAAVATSSVLASSSSTPASSASQPASLNADINDGEQVTFADQIAASSSGPAAMEDEDAAPAVSTTTTAIPEPASPTPSLKRKRSEGNADKHKVTEALDVGTSSAPPQPPSPGERGSPTKRARTLGWCTIA